jgi:CPA2 family monovalent cation:H+ antiporter-2
MELVGDLALVLAAALVGGFLAQRFGQPLIVGYILAGVAVGPFTGGLTVARVHEIEQLSELGVALLLFSLGLEVSFRELAPVRGVALGGAAIQVVLTIALGFGLARAIGFDWQQAIWFGALVSLSSTMVALKTIQAQGRLGTLSSRVMLGMLVVQDLAVVPLIIVLPELSNPAGGATRVIVATLRAAALLAAIVLVSTQIVPRLMAFVARRNSRELFLLATTTLAIGVGYVTWRLGLSLALGAFVAGLVINESEYSHQALSDVIPLRDLFGMLFFVSVGMLLDPMIVREQPGTLLLVVGAVIIGKGLIFAGVVRVFGYRHVVPFAVGLTLFQVGEFAFVLASVGRETNAISNTMYALVLDTAVATMVLTPIVSGLTPHIYGRIAARRRREEPLTSNVPSTGLADHVVIAGAGRVGRSIADALVHLGLPFVLLEIDDRRVRQARSAGLPLVYGDSSQTVVLEAAGLGRALAILITVPAFSDVRDIVRAVRRVRADVPIIARADGSEALRALYDLGIQEVTSPEFEAAIEMTRQALLRFKVPAHEVLQVASAIRRERYGVGGEPAEDAEAIARMSEVARHLDLTWMRLSSDSSFNGRSIGELEIRTRFGASVVGIVRAQSLTANPDAAARLHAGDLIAALGTRDQIARFERAASSSSVTAIAGADRNG